MSTVFDELVSRAGESDLNYQAWLDQRRRGVTATEMKRLATGLDFEVLWTEKFLATPVEPNKYLSWGKIAEERIAGSVREADSRWMWEHRLFHADGDARLLASPDMVRVVDGSVDLAEIKTSKNDLTDARVFDRTGYFYQMQWQMFVCGARTCVLVAQQHNDVWVDRGGEFPVPEMTYGLTYETFGRDETVISSMVELAHDYFRVAGELDRWMNETCSHAN